MDGKVVIGTELDTKGFDKEIALLQFKLDDIRQTLTMADEDKTLFSSSEVREMEAEAQKLARRIDSLKEKQAKLDGAGFSNMKKSIDNINNSMQKTISKIVHWGLAVFGVRSAYMGIRQAMNLVLSNNEYLSNQMQQMKNVIASALTPLVQTIVNLLAKAMVYVNYIFYRLTGKNLFDFSKATANASNSLKNGAKNSGAIADNLKEARKQLAGFDEMNVLSDNVASSSGGAGGLGDEFENIFDKLSNIKIPKWLEKLGNLLQKLKKYWKELLIVVASFGATILALKITNFIADLLKLSNVTTSVKAGIGLLVSGLVMLIGAVINLTKNWDTMTSKEKIINIALASIGAAFVALGYSIMTGVSVATLGIGLLIAAIVAMVTSIGTQIYKEEKAIKVIYDETVQQEELTEAKNRAKEAYDNLINAIDEQANAEENLIDVQDRTGLSGEELYRSVENGTLTYQNMTKEQRETYKAYLDLITANQNLKNANDEKIASDSRVIKKEYDVQIANGKTGKTFNKLRDDIIEAYNRGEITAQDASDSISRMMGRMSVNSYQTFVKDIPDDIKNGLEPGKYKSTFDKFKDVWNNWISNLKRNLELKITGKVSTSGGSGHGFAKGGVVYHSLPKLAPGGIINQPGRGVPIGSAIAGERGAEGVIPLTDSQQMALLGEAIGRYITVNANITNTMNGRVISRELQRVQNDSDFAYNR